LANFTPIGTDYSSIAPQVQGMTSYVGESITKNGEDLAQLAIMACAKAGTATCKVAYLEGFKALPLDNARTKSLHGQDQGAVQHRVGCVGRGRIHPGLPV